jgi:hypothetical protein
LDLPFRLTARPLQRELRRNLGDDD